MQIGQWRHKPAVLHTAVLSWCYVCFTLTQADDPVLVHQRRLCRCHGNGPLLRSVLYCLLHPPKHCATSYFHNLLVDSYMSIEQEYSCFIFWISLLKCVSIRNQLAASLTWLWLTCITWLTKLNLVRRSRETLLMRLLQLVLTSISLQYYHVLKLTGSLLYLCFWWFLSIQFIFLYTRLCFSF